MPHAHIPIFPFDRMLRICISGLTCSGKTTLGSLLAKELEIAHIAHSYKTDHDTFSGMLETLKGDSAAYARAFDRKVASEARRRSCVVSTWLGPWLVSGATVRVWLEAQPEERALRCSKAAHLSLAAARRYVSQKDKYTALHFRKVYDIDIYDHARFDMVLNTSRLKQQESVAIISMLALHRSRRRF